MSTPRKPSPQRKAPAKPKAAATRSFVPKKPLLFAIGAVLIVGAVLLAFNAKSWFSSEAEAKDTSGVQNPHNRALYTTVWLQRAMLIDEQFRRVYSAGWEGANGAIGDAYLFAATGDSSLLRFHTVEHNMRYLFDGTWVDDRAWNALAELYWWEITGRTNSVWVASAKQRYLSARDEGRLSKHEGFWSWYNWPPNAKVNDRIFTNSNMNQMVNVACRLYEATGEKRFLDDALMVWNGDGTTPGVEKMFYRGEGRWEGAKGLAAFGKQLPWEGTEYCSVLASLYRITKEERYKRIIVATARRIMDPATGWVDPVDFYQIHMDGNGAFVHYLMDAYVTAPDELADIPEKVGTMLEHVWTNNHGKATVVLHRTTDHGIRNGWNPRGGEDGYGVDQIGGSHSQSQAVRAFGVYAAIMKGAMRGK